MTLVQGGYIDLPSHVQPGGFDHAAVHRATGRIYVAHTANDTLDVIDGPNDRYLHSISFTLSIDDIASRNIKASIPVPGRTRWTVYDQDADVFYVNIADPPQIAVVDAKNSTRVERAFPIPAAGPHGLDLDAAQQRLFCACDGKRLVVVNTRSGQVLNEHEISGSPDVIFFSAELQHLYVAIGDPGVIEVFNTGTLHLTEQVQTQKGAHTLAFDPMHNEVYAFLPQTHRAAVYTDMNE